MTLCIPSGTRQKIATASLSVAFALCFSSEVLSDERATSIQPASDPLPNASIDVAAGSLIYRQNCARCHGFKMMTPASGVFDLRTFPRDDKARFLTSVSKGKGGMPAWEGTLQTSEMEALWLYIRSESTAP